MKKIIGLILFFLFGFFVVANAQNNSSREDRKAEIDANKVEREDERETKKEELEAMREEKIQEHCEIVEKRIQNQVKNLNQNHKNREKAYGEIENKIENLIINLKKQEIDTSNLESKFREFQTLVNSFYEEHNNLMNEINSTEDYVCGKSEGEFKNQLKIAREQLKITHNERLKARNYFFEKVRPELLQIREQVLEQNRAGFEDGIEVEKE